MIAVLETQKPGFTIKNSSARVQIFNQCSDIKLIKRQSSAANKGKRYNGDRSSTGGGQSHEDRYTTTQGQNYGRYVLPGDQDEVIIKPSKVPFRHAKGCLIYEIVDHNSRLPFIWGSRIFLVISVSIVPYRVKKRKVAVKLISSHLDSEEITKNSMIYIRACWIISCILMVKDLIGI
jgi:hypothetical protein